MKRPLMMRWMVIGLSACLVSGVYFLVKTKPPFSSREKAGDEKGSPLLRAALETAKERAQTHAQDPEARRALARLYHANRFYSEAREAYLLLAKTNSPLTAVDHHYLADIAQNEGDLSIAQKELRLVLQMEPRYLPARVILAETLFKSGQEVEAANEYSVIVTIEADHPQATLGLARIDLQQGNDVAAVARLERLMLAHPEQTSGAALLAQVLSRRGETERAANMTQWSRQMREPIPVDPWLDTLLVDCYDAQRLSLKFEDFSNSGQIAEALPLLSRVEELDPKSPIPQLLRGWPLARAKRYGEAVTEYRKALDKGAYPEKVCPLIVSTLLADGKAAEATQFIAEYYAKNPDSIPLLTSYAEAATRSGDEKTARTLLSKLLQQQPYLYMPNMSLAKILWTAGERDEAVKCLQRVVKVFAVDVPSRGLLGQYYLEKSDSISAIPPLEEAIAQQNAHTPEKIRLTAMLNAAYLKTGINEVEHQRFAEATAYYDKAIALSPADLRAYACKASVYFHLKQFSKATACLQKMAELEPKNPTIYISLGDSLYQDGKHEEGRQVWQKALQLTEPSDTELRNDLKNRLNGKITAETFK